MIFSFHFEHSYAKRYNNDQKEKKTKGEKEEERSKFSENAMLKYIITKKSLNTSHLMYNNFRILKNFDLNT